MSNGPKTNPSDEEPPGLELKPLPSSLKYVFLTLYLFFQLLFMQVYMNYSGEIIVGSQGQQGSLWVEHS